MSVQIVSAKAKLKKIEKMKSRKLLPRLVMIALVLVLYLFTTAIAMEMIMQNMIGTKVLQGYEIAQKASILVNEKMTESVVRRDIYNMQRTLPEIRSVCMVDADGNLLKQFGDQIPNFEDEVSYLFSGSEVTLIPLPEGLSLDFDAEGIIKNRLLTLLSLRPGRTQLARNENISLNIANKAWFQMPIWFVVPCNDHNDKVCVLSYVEVSKFEAFCFFGVALFLGLIGLIFLIFLIVEMARTITDQRKAFKLINTDFVTLGNNKIFFNDFGTRLLKKRKNREYVVVHLRMEKYRLYCTYHGQSEGEDLLQRIYVTLGNQLQKRELVAHIEGADFAMLLIQQNPNQTNQRIQEILTRIVNLGHGGLLFSAGVSPVKESCDPTLYFNEAGIARGTITVDAQVRIAWFNEELLAAQIWEHKVEEDMDRAIANKEFKVYLQPKYNTTNETLGGAEALIRWIHPTEGFVPPGKFIPIFERNGFITKIDDYMISEVAHQQAIWYKEGKPIVPVSVNVSRVHFLRTDLAEHICEMVDRYGLPHEYLELELTESAFFDDKAVLLSTVRKLKELGFSISMDDFGAGYSSLNSLKELPLDVVKLDAEFFRGTDDLERANLIVSRTIELAKQLGMQIVAEGIETRDQVDFLAEKHCDLIQGYYFAKPMPISEYEEKAFAPQTNSL